MSTTEEPSAHKRNASATSAVQTTPPPAKRPSVPSVNALPPAHRQFPHAVALVLYRDGGDDVSSTTSVLGVYADLADANAEVRKLALEQGAKIGGEGAAAASDVNPVRWDAPDGVSCWVEWHAVKPKRLVPRTVSSGSSPAEQQPRKLYDAEEGEDPDLDDDQDEGGHYD